MKKKRNLKKTVSGLMPFIKPYKWNFVIAILMILVFNITIVLAPTFEGMITTQLASDIAKSSGLSNININFNAVLKIIILLFIIYIFKTVSQMISVVFLTNGIQHSMEDLRNALQNKIRKLPVRYFDNHHFGDVLSRITNDVDAVSNALQQSFTQIISGILMVTLALTMMYIINPKMAIVGTMIIPLSLIITRIVVGKSQKLFKSQQDTLGKLNSTITEMYTGYNEILLYNQQDEAIDKFKEINKDLKTNAFKAQFVSSTIAPLNSLVTYLAIGTVAVIGTAEVITGTFLVGQLQAFIRYIWQINDPLSQISNLSAQIQAAFAALSRIVELLEEQEEIPEASPAKHIENVQGNVQFEHVQFGYYEENLMKEINSIQKRKEVTGIDYLRLVFNIPEDYENSEFMINLLNEKFKFSDDIKIEVVNGYIEKKRQANKEQVKEIFKNYDIIFEKDIPLENKISYFIKEKNEKEIIPENVKKYLSFKAIELLKD